MDDYIKKYINGNNFDIHALINDDFIIAIKKMWNDKHYTSCLKLLVSFIDTMAFIENGDSTGELFKQWLKTYVDLRSVKVTPEELWEHRNAILHMSHYNSRKVSAGKVLRLVPCNAQVVPKSGDDTYKYYSLHCLLIAVMKGVGNYVTIMANDDQMRKRFCDNYIKTMSDSHFSTLGNHY